MGLDLFAGARVRNYDAAKSWYVRLLGKDPAFFPHATEAVWSPDPADPTPTLVGIIVAAALSAAGVGLWSGRVSRRVVLLCAAAVPVVALAVSPWSSDFQGLVPAGLLGLLWLWWFLRRPVAIGWVGRHSSGRH